MTEKDNLPLEQSRPTTDKELQDMERTIPADDRSIYESFNTGNESIASVIGNGFLGLDDKTAYSILKRSNIDAEEIQPILRLIRKAEHGIGGGSLDRPIPYIGEQVKHYLEAKISITDDKGHGMSRIEAVDALTSWTRSLEAREAEVKKQQQKGATG